nr:hypothetical protein [Tanacetum cinerariifolium]
MNYLIIVESSEKKREEEARKNRSSGSTADWFLNEVWNSRSVTECEGLTLKRIDNLTDYFHDGQEGHGCSVPGDTFAFQESSGRRELPRANVHTVSIGGNVSSRLSTETHHVLDTTTVPLSRVFDRSKNLGLNVFGSDYMCHAEARQIQTTPVGTAVTRVDEGGLVRTDPLITASLDESFYPHGICSEGVGTHVSPSSTTTPVNHAYLCLNVTDHVIRPEIIPSRTSGLENAYQSHAREENLDIIGTMSRRNE